MTSLADVVEVHSPLKLKQKKQHTFVSQPFIVPSVICLQESKGTLYGHEVIGFHHIKEQQFSSSKPFAIKKSCLVAQYVNKLESHFEKQRVALKKNIAIIPISFIKGTVI